ncbi:glycerol-3-phosphate acyltransferase [Alicyclobacillus contaminans]|uniref:glycerol-3-phosphate 1-O-acyltransferase PlsY n=1 Tax=Alicyclobacillus contaminans TaxID=392016 RepID=UPI00040F72FE|nr:glycerol-3-phosphate 1-O-acyltransferase PlsY [Alicyclobacillus contaminans]GMA52520.1 glycerol-3-phosphate acyltransferase [Alicyclobacillus contaminans]
MLIVSVILSYLIGSISSSTLLGRWIAKIDIREHGSGNAGATNTLRVLGWRLAIIVLLADVLKGMVAICLAWNLGHGGAWTTYLSGLAVIVGHNWPIFFGFRGGKGVATTIGVLLLTMPVPAVLAGVLAIVLVLVTRIVSVGALTFTILTPIFLILLEHHRTGALVFAIVIALLSIYQHRQNLVRLMNGRENRIFSK